MRVQSQLLNIGSAHAKKIATNHNDHDQCQQHWQQARKKFSQEIIHAMYIKENCLK
jgi:hypothetical protein